MLLARVMPTVYLEALVASSSAFGSVLDDLGSHQHVSEDVGLEPRTDIFILTLRPANTEESPPNVACSVKRENLNSLILISSSRSP